MTFLIWIPALSRMSWSNAGALFFASSNMPPLNAFCTIISHALVLKVFSIRISFGVTMPSLLVCNSQVRIVSNMVGSPSVIMTVPSRSTCTAQDAKVPSSYPAVMIHCTSRVTPLLKSALLTIWSIPISGISERSCCSPWSVSVNSCWAVSNFWIVASWVMIDVVVFFMTVAHLYCNHAQKPYIQTSTIMTIIRYLVNFFIKKNKTIKNLYLANISK